MNGYVAVRFDRHGGRTYIYKLPDHITLSETKECRYAIVENIFYDAGEDLAPYSFVEIVGGYNGTWKFDFPVTKYIVDVVDSNWYKDMKNTQKKQKRAEAFDRASRAILQEEEIKTVDDLIELFNNLCNEFE